MPTKLPKYTVTLEIRTDAPKKAVKSKKNWAVFVFDPQTELDYAVAARILSVEVAT